MDRVREAGALDVTVLPATMKHGRQGARVEVLCRATGRVSGWRICCWLRRRPLASGAGGRATGARGEVIQVTVLGHVFQGQACHASERRPASKT